MGKLLFLFVLQVIYLNGAFSKYVGPENFHARPEAKAAFLERDEKILNEGGHNFKDENGKTKFDFEELAQALEKHEHLKHAREYIRYENGKPKFDLENFFEKLNDHAEESEEATQDLDELEDQPWKREDVDRLKKLLHEDERAVSKDPTSFLKEVLAKAGPLGKAFELNGKKEAEEECPVGTIYTYALMGRLKECFSLNLVKLVLKLHKYRLTEPSEDPPEFPTETTNLIEAVATPVLNHPSSVVVLNGLLQGLKSYDIKKPLKLTWPFLWLGNSLRNKQLATQYLAPGRVPNLTTYDGYAAFFDEYREKQKERLFGIFPVKDFIHYPLAEDPMFHGITESNRWQSDDVFVQQRLAGLNPMSLRRASAHDPVLEFLNTSGSWGQILEEITGESFNETCRKGKMFIVEYPLLRGIKDIEDIEVNDPNKRVLRKTVSPIALFVSVPAETGKNESTLKPVGIQMDSDPVAPVFSPNDGSKWLMAKAEVQRADIVYVEIIEHLLKTHLLMEPICAIMRRSFSKLHPLYQLFDHHCKYLPVTNSVGLPALFDQNEFLHILFSMGNTGSINLLNKGYKEMSWDDTDFEKNLRDRGVMDKETLPYFPYRDDGLLLWNEIGKFAKEYVKLYYHSRPKIKASVKISILPEISVSAPLSLVSDIELQMFAMQLSKAKIGIIPGGKFKDFPSTITSVEQLVDVVKRILFIPVQHSAINYPVSYYGAFTPNMPTKLYDPNTQDFTINNLPYYNIVSYQLSIAMTLGSIRYDKIFDYSEQMKSEKAKVLVKKYYDIFHDDINKKIYEENCLRQIEDKFSYPYFMPQWLTNSIQT